MFEIIVIFEATMTAPDSPRSPRKAARRQFQHSASDGSVSIAITDRTSKPHGIRIKDEAGSAQLGASVRLELTITIVAVLVWIASNMAVLLLNKLLLTTADFRHPVLLTLFHMVSGTMFSWGLASVRFLRIQPMQSWQQGMKMLALSVVFSLAVLCANVSLRFLPISFNQALGATTPAFTALFVLMLQGQMEHHWTYCTLVPIIGGVVVASGVEPDFHIFGSAICLLGAAFRGLRSVLQAILLSTKQEKLDSMSCLAYMAPISTLFLIVMCPILEPGSWQVLLQMPGRGWSLPLLISANCFAAFLSNYLNMVVTQRTDALTLQVLGQCKGIVSAVTSVAFFKNVVTTAGWFGYGLTVAGCLAYGQAKRRFHGRQLVSAAMQPSPTPRGMHKSKLSDISLSSLDTETQSATTRLLVKSSSVTPDDSPGGKSCRRVL